jgi:hypothetical protein
MLTTEKVVLTNHVFNRICERVSCCRNISKNEVLNEINNSVPPSNKQIKNHFAYTDNTGKFIVYNERFGVFFVLKNEYSRIIAITCIKEKVNKG